MTRKDCYNLSLKICQTILRFYFRSEETFWNSYFQKRASGKALVKKVYDILEPLVVTEK